MEYYAVFKKSNVYIHILTQNKIYPDIQLSEKIQGVLGWLSH